MRFLNYTTFAPSRKLEGQLVHATLVINEIGKRVINGLLLKNKCVAAKSHPQLSSKRRSYPEHMAERIIIRDQMVITPRMRDHLRRHPQAQNLPSLQVLTSK